MKKYLLLLTCVPVLALPHNALAQKGDFPSPGSLSTLSWAIDSRDRESAVSVVTFKTPDQKTLDETAEDLNILSVVFSQNLERALGEEAGDTVDYKLGIPMLLQTGGRSVEAGYIDGFGAVFNLKVRFPLLPGAAVDEDTKTAPPNSEWEQARRELAGGGQTRFRPSPQIYGARFNEAAEHYNAKLVEKLKKRVLELLKNASNLRHVQPDEWVAVTFAGPPNAVTRHHATQGSAGNNQPLPELPADPGDASVLREETQPSGGLPGGIQNGQPASPRTPERATMMAIRIQKRDADALAAGKMSEEDFFRAAKVATYLGPVILNDPANDYLGSSGAGVANFFGSASRK